MSRVRASLFLFIFYIVLYIGVLFIFTYKYGQERWMPKLILELPSLTISSKKTQKDIIAPEVLEKKDYSNSDFQVLFDMMPLPAVDLVRPWREETNALENYSKTVSDRKLPKLSIILTDVGLDSELFVQALQKLPTSLTLSFSPYSLDLPQKIRYARKMGFENLMDIPSQQKDTHLNAGNYALAYNMSQNDVSSLLQEQYFDQAFPFIGFTIEKIPFSDSFWTL